MWWKRLQLNYKPSLFVKVLCSILLFLLIAVGTWSLFRSGPDAETRPAEKPFVDPGILMSYPTAQTRLADTNNPAVYMPTGSGRIESAWYGSVRTRNFGSSYLPAFHEGVDIAPTARDSKGRAIDAVYTVADGRIGYINRIAGNSSYGVYVVMFHSNRLGEYYTLYAHLASVTPGIHMGDRIPRGTQIGQMGHTTTLDIPVSRSHLHFEIGTMFNDRFSSWYRKQEMKPYHGNMHGYNLGGLNPMGVFPYMHDKTLFDFQEYILNYPVAYRMIVRNTGKLDYYNRYPALWIGPDPSGALVMDVSENGVPLKARAATPEERTRVQKDRASILEVFPEVLGRNGDRVIVQKNGKWVMGSDSQQWLDILLYR